MKVKRNSRYRLTRIELSRQDVKEILGGDDASCKYREANKRWWASVFISTEDMKKYPSWSDWPMPRKKSWLARMLGLK